MGHRGPGEGESSNGVVVKAQKASHHPHPSAICQQESPPSTPSADVKEILYKELQKQLPGRGNSRAKAQGQDLLRVLKEQQGCP